jgi:signal transduction histidine kinase
MLEDRPSDAELSRQELIRAGFIPQCRRVDTELEFLAALDPAPDLVLADYRLPNYDGLRALDALHERGLDVPFIVISGALDAEVVAQCIKRGVADYLLKDRLDRLGLAVANALAERRLRLEARRVEEQLRQSQKLEAVGQLASGIAHDFNNILTVINGWVGAMLEADVLPPDAPAILREVLGAGERAAGLTRQLLLFGRKGEARREAINLNILVEQVLAMLRRLIGENISLEFSGDPGLPALDADPVMMEQILLNLAVNARDAMPRCGRMKIEVRAVRLAPPGPGAHSGARAGDFVRLSVRDTGCGIPADVLPRIFEPFYTTKGPGTGTGMGLATVYGIVKSHGGWIEVESQLGLGTSFQVFLPQSAGALSASPAAPVHLASPLAKGGGETVLVVEDEASVRQFAVAALNRQGYRVLEARSGSEALEVWARHCGRIDLVITDMVMPGDMTGMELGARLKAQKADLPVILSSGYSDGRTGYDRLEKPYSLRQLAQAVRSALDAHSVLALGLVLCLAPAAATFIFQLPLQSVPP